jgi:hypothetical protein
MSCKLALVLGRPCHLPAALRGRIPDSRLCRGNTVPVNRDLGICSDTTVHGGTPSSVPARARACRASPGKLLNAGDRTETAWLTTHLDVVRDNLHTSGHNLRLGSPMAQRASPLRDSGAVQETQSSDLPRGLQAVFKVAGAVVAPTTAVTALAYYFAVKRQETLARYFGIDTSVLGFSVQDYLLRVGDALFIVLLFGALIGLCAIQAHRAVTGRLDYLKSRAWTDTTILGVQAVGAALLLVGLIAMFEPLPFKPHFIFRSMSFGIGISLLAYAIFVRNELLRSSTDRHAASWLSIASVVLVATIVFLSLFWTTKDLAQALGRGQARELERSLDQQPGTIVYSERDLNLDATGVTEELLPGGETAFIHRYSGLRLLIKSDDRYFLIPNDWTHDDGVTILLLDDDSIRIEFEPGQP